MSFQVEKKVISRRSSVWRQAVIEAGLAGAAAAVLMAVTVGCGSGHDGRVPVSGEVKLSGQPIDRGSIEFHPLNPGGVLTGGMIMDGKFDIPAEQGAKPGKYQVRVFAAGETMPVDPSVPPGPQTDTQVSTERVGAKFNVDSELVVEIAATGNRNLSFEVFGP